MNHTGVSDSLTARCVRGGMMFCRVQGKGVVKRQRWRRATMMNSLSPSDVTLLANHHHHV